MVSLEVDGAAPMLVIRKEVYFGQLVAVAGVYAYTKDDPQHLLALRALLSAFSGRDAEALFYLGNAFCALKRLDEALAAYEQAVALDPNNATAWYNKVVVLRDLKRPDEALAAYQQALMLQLGDSTYNEQVFMFQFLERPAHGNGA